MHPARLAGIPTFSHGGRISGVACFDRTLPPLLHPHPSSPQFLPARSALLSWLRRHDAGPPTPSERRPPHSRRAARICDQLVAVRPDNQEPAHQRRHEGAIPGFYGEAGNVSGVYAGYGGRGPADAMADFMPSRRLNMVRARFVQPSK